LGLVVFKERFWAGLRDGSITVAFRRWRRPSVRAGGTLLSPGGVLAIDAVEVVDESVIDDDAARAAGYVDRAEVLRNLRGDGTLFRIRFHRVGDDPRLALREQTELTSDELAAATKMATRNEWVLPYLRLIEELPATVSTVLAERVGMERFAFKQRVRRLKAVGLTESLEVGYRLSPRGEVVLRALSDARPRPQPDRQGSGR